MANPTALYSHQGREPRQLPHTIRLSDGRKRTDATTFTDEELADIGVTGPYEVPSYDPETQKLSWDSETLSFSVNEISDEEFWAAVRERRNRLLAESDWTMLADASPKVNFREWEMYRERLRQLPELYADSRENFTWPISPEGRPDSDFDQERVFENTLRFRVIDLERAVAGITTTT